MKEDLIVGIILIILAGEYSRIKKFLVRKVNKCHQKFIAKIKRWRYSKQLALSTKELRERISNEALKSSEGLSTLDLQREIFMLSGWSAAESVRKGLINVALVNFPDSIKLKSFDDMLKNFEESLRLSTRRKY